MIRLRSLLVLLVVVVAGCSQQDLKLQLVPAADQALGMYYVNLLRSRSFDEIDRAAEPSVRGPKLYAALLKMTETLPEEQPSSAKMVDAQITADKEGTRTKIIYEYGFPGKWVIAEVIMLRKQASVSLVGLSVRAIPESVEEHHRFRLAGKSVTHYTALTLAILFPLLTLYALVTCLRTKLSRLKWAWVLFIVFGIGNCTLNWTTGETQFSALTLRLLSASIDQLSFGPWLLSLSFPLGAVVFLLLKKKLTVAVSPA